MTGARRSSRVTQSAARRKESFLFTLAQLECYPKTLIEVDCILVEFFADASWNRLNSTARRSEYTPYDSLVITPRAAPPSPHPPREPPGELRPRIRMINSRFDRPVTVT